MKDWLKGGLIGGIIGICLHLLFNFGPLIIGYLSNSRNILEISNMTLSYNVIRIIIYLIIGFVIGALIGLIINKIKGRKR